MYRKIKPTKTSISCNTSYEGEPIEAQLVRMMTNGEGLENALTQKIYTERKEGVLPELNIRTDRFELAVDAMTKGADRHKEGRKAKAEGMAQKAKEGQDKEAKTGGASNAAGAAEGGA